jgi:hypothetical protein
LRFFPDGLVSGLQMDKLDGIQVDRYKCIMDCT